MRKLIWEEGPNSTANFSKWTTYQEIQQKLGVLKTTQELIVR